MPLWQVGVGQRATSKPGTAHGGKQGSLCGSLFVLAVCDLEWLGSSVTENG